MSDWALVLHHTPLVAARLGLGNGQIALLTKATSRSLTFSLDDQHEVSFNMPGKHPQTALVKKGLTDVVVYCGEQRVMRYRVISRRISKKGGVVSVAFTAASYKAVLDHRFFHDSDTRRWVATQQADIAWSMVTATQTKTVGDLGIARGAVPEAVADTVRSLVGDDASDGSETAAYEPGASIGGAIADLGRLLNGFDWDVQPTSEDGASVSPLRFDLWRERGRDSTFQLDDGGNVQAWDEVDSMDDYANVLLVTGRASRSEDGESVDAPVIYWPDTHNPIDSQTDYGRWERTDQVDYDSAGIVTERAARMHDDAVDPKAEWTVTLRAGRWLSPADLWLGDRTRLLLRVDTQDEFGVADPLIDVEETVRVHQVGINLSDTGGVQVTMTVGRRPATDLYRYLYEEQRKAANARIAAAKRQADLVRATLEQAKSVEEVQSIKDVLNDLRARVDALTAAAATPGA